MEQPVFHEIEDEEMKARMAIRITRALGRAMRKAIAEKGEPLAVFTMPPNPSTRD